MLAVLFTRRWLTALLVAVLFFVACGFLGRWQFHRYEDRRQQVDLVEAYYDADPLPLDQVLPEGSDLPSDQVWRRVEVSGEYDAAAQLMVRNRPQNVTYGFEQLVPLTLPEGDAILVDRGWVQNAERADVVPDVPEAPGGTVQVVGWLRQGEAALDRSMPPGQVASIDLAEAADRTGYPLRGAYLLLDSEDVGDGTTPPRPQPLLPPVTDTGPHLAYALQWWGASIVGFVLVVVYARREHLDSLPEGDPRKERARKPKKLRVWDEEDG
ncbi:MAG: SURF1 family protein [Mobilicoccus sp.]|nr:SURF1 family protein [Mobilicoccus sp.]